MKKITKISLIFIICLYVFLSVAFASTNTTHRSEDNLQINSRITVTSKNKPLILKTPKVNENEKVYDFANLFTNEEESKLYTNITKYIDKYNFDMVVVTINDNNKINAMNYADDFYDYNYFGKGSTCDGILFLIDMDTREMWISTTGECIRVYNDIRIDNILDKTYNYISNKKYYECANAFITEANKYASNGVPDNNKNTYINDKGDYINMNSDVHEKSSIFELVMYSTIFAFVLTVIIIVIQAFKHRTIKKASNANAYFDNSEFKLTQKEDSFINTHTDRIYDPPSSSSSSGGGSSTHSGSSGISHGGGGRSF